MGNIRFIWLVAHDLILAKLLKLFLLAETQCLLIELTSFVRHQNLALGWNFNTKNPLQNIFMSHVRPKTGILGLNPAPLYDHIKFAFSNSLESSCMLAKPQQVIPPIIYLYYILYYIILYNIIYYIILYYIYVIYIYYIYVILYIYVIYIYIILYICYIYMLQTYSKYRLLHIYTKNANNLWMDFRW